MSNDYGNRIYDLKIRKGETGREWSDRLEARSRSRKTLPGRHPNEDVARELETAHEIWGAVEKLLGIDYYFKKGQPFRANSLHSATNLVSVEHELWKWAKLLVALLEEY